MRESKHYVDEDLASGVHRTILRDMTIHSFKNEVRTRVIDTRPVREEILYRDLHSYFLYQQGAK